MTVQNRGEGSVPVWTFRLLLVLALIAVMLVAAVPGSEALCSSTLVRDAIPKTAYNCFEFWLNRYQAFGVGVFAVVATLTAGYWALSGARSQIAQAARSEADRRERDHHAARAVLPLSLSSLSGYANRCAKALSEVLFAVGTGKSITFDPPEIPSDAIKSLQDVVRSADPDIAKAITKLIVGLQIQASRLSSLTEEINHEFRVVTLHELHSNIIDAAQINALCSCLFAYARGADAEDWRPEIEIEKIRQALRLAGIWDEEYPELYKLLELRTLTPPG